MIDAMKQALEALEFFRDTAICSADTDTAEEAVTSLRQAIADAEKQGDDVYVMGNYAGKGKVSSVTLGGVSFTGNGTARREADVKPTGFFFQMPEAEKQEPVAWITGGGNGELWWHQSSKFDEEGNFIGDNPDDIPLYTSPQQRHPLTDEEMYLAIRPLFRTDETAQIAFNISKDEYRAIEAALRSKNT